MTTLSIADLRSDEAIQPRLKWEMDAEGQWYRAVIARNGNTEHFIRRIADIDIDPPTERKGKL